MSTNPPANAPVVGYGALPPGTPPSPGQPQPQPQPPSPGPGPGTGTSADDVYSTGNADDFFSNGSREEDPLLPNQPYPGDNPDKYPGNNQGQYQSQQRGSGFGGMENMMMMFLAYLVLMALFSMTPLGALITIGFAAGATYSWMQPKQQIQNAPPPQQQITPPPQRYEAPHHDPARNFNAPFPRDPGDPVPRPRPRTPTNNQQGLY